MSYTSQQFLIFDNSTDANFRSWGSAISAAIASMGWVSNGDSGQVNWTTVTSPASGVFVYECWKPGDAGTTFVLKVEYGSGSGSPKGPRIRMSISTTSNGSGTLTGFVSSIIEAMATGTAGTGATTYDCYFSGDTDRLSMMLWRSGSSIGPVIYSVERTHNTDGTNNADGVTLIGVAPGSSSTNAGQQTLVFAIGAGVISASRTYLALYSGNNASAAFNNNIPISPIFPEYGKYGNPLTTIGFVHTADVAEGCFFTTTLYGSTRTYIATGIPSNITPANNKVCVRYD